MYEYMEKAQEEIMALVVNNFKVDMDTPAGYRFAGELGLVLVQLMDSINKEAY